MPNIVLSHTLSSGHPLLTGLLFLIEARSINDQVIIN